MPLLSELSWSMGNHAQTSCSCIPTEGLPERACLRNQDFDFGCLGLYRSARRLGGYWSTSLQSNRQPLLPTLSHASCYIVEYNDCNHLNHCILGGISLRIPSLRCSGGRSEKGACLKRSAYREPDYSFGQTVLTLRTRIGLTQANLGDLLGVSRRTVCDWEAGNTYPSPEHLTALITLAIEHQAFPGGREAEEIGVFWHAAHQKVLLDESGSPSCYILPGPLSHPNHLRFMRRLFHGWIGTAHLPSQLSMAGRGK